MKKKCTGITALAAFMVLSTGITAFAGSWKTDAQGTYYENDNGTRPVYAGWFTDPADGSMYYMNPDGYMMSDTTVEGYKLGSDGRRIEKTEEDILKEAQREASATTHNSPRKQNATAMIAANNAKATNIASGTLRHTYQAEMTALMDKILMESKGKRTNKTVQPYKHEDNVELLYAFKNPDNYQFITSIIWKGRKESDVDYKEYAYEMRYHFDAAEADQSVYDEAYQKLAIAALGETEGNAVVTHVQSQREAGHTNFDRTGSTDTGNTYKLTYNDNFLTLTVTCNGGTLNTTAEESDTTAENADTTVERDSAEVSAPIVETSRVITVGD